MHVTVSGRSIRLFLLSLAASLMISHSFAQDAGMTVYVFNK